MVIYRGVRKYAVTMENLEISTGNQNLDSDTDIIHFHIHICVKISNHILFFICLINLDMDNFHFHFGSDADVSDTNRHFLEYEYRIFWIIRYHFPPLYLSKEIVL